MYEKIVDSLLAVII